MQSAARKPAADVEPRPAPRKHSPYPPGPGRPRVAAGRHSHPGDEASYALQGAVVQEPDGGQPVGLKVGQAGFTPAGQTHNVKNASSSEPAKLLNCILVAKGQPLATRVP